jgi:hypothetical protein
LENRGLGITNSEVTIEPKSRRDKGSSKSQLTCISEFWRIGTQESENQVLNIASCKVAIKRKFQQEEVSIDWPLGFGDSKAHLLTVNLEAASSDPPKAKKGGSRRRESVGCRFPDREIEEPWSSSGREEEDPVRVACQWGRDCTKWYQSGSILCFL